MCICVVVNSGCRIQININKYTKQRTWTNNGRKYDEGHETSISLPHRCRQLHTSICFNIDSLTSVEEESKQRNSERIEEVKKMIDQKASQFEEMKNILDQKTIQLDELALNFSFLMSSVDDLERSSAHLKHHLNNLSEQIQKFQCHLLGQTYQNGQTLRNHIQRSQGTPKT
jgi:chromosome segregation ATPase